MTHVQARTGCGCKQQLLKHKISSGTYLLWGKFESLGSGAALRQEMPLRGGARSEQSQMCQLCSTGKVCPWQKRRGAQLFWCVTALGQHGMMQEWCRNDAGFGLGGSPWVNTGRVPANAGTVPTSLIPHIKLDNMLATSLLPLLVADFISFS